VLAKNCFGPVLRFKLVQSRTSHASVSGGLAALSAQVPLDGVEMATVRTTPIGIVVTTRSVRCRTGRNNNGNIDAPFLSIRLNECDEPLKPSCFSAFQTADRTDLAHEVTAFGVPVHDSIVPPSRWCCRGSQPIEREHL